MWATLPLLPPSLAYIWLWAPERRKTVVDVDMFLFGDYLREKQLWMWTMLLMPP